MALAWNICAPLGTLSTFFFNPVFQLSTAMNEINLFNNHVLIVAPVTCASAGATTPSVEFLFFIHFCLDTTWSIRVAEWLAISISDYWSWVQIPQDRIRLMTVGCFIAQSLSSKYYLTLVLLNPDIPCPSKQCRSRSVGFWRSALFAIKYVNL